MPDAPRKCFFFDRDGIVNEPPGPGYVTSWDEFRLLPEFPVLLRKVTDAGFSAVIITNQRGVARGLMSEDTLKEIHDRLLEELQRSFSLSILDIFYCPHERDTCSCRKPQPGMILAAAGKHNIDIASSWMVGDQASDIETGKRAGCRTIYVSASPARNDADITVTSMKELVSIIDNVLASGPI